MKKSSHSAALMVLLTLLCGCINVSRVSEFSNNSEANWDPKYSAELNRTGQIQADVSFLEVENAFGTVQVEGREGPGQWSWNLTARAHSNELAEAAAASVACQPQWDGRRFRLIVSLPESQRGRNFTSDLVIRVPSTAAVQVRNSFGKTSVYTASGANLKSQHGSLEIRKIAGLVEAETSFGSIELSDAGTATLKNQHGKIAATNVRGDLTAHTSFGALEASDIKGNARLRNQHGAIKADKISGAVDASTSFGPMDIDSAGPEIVGRNQHGAVHIAATSPALARLDASTSFGPLDLTLPAGLDPAIQARTSFGEIESDFAVLMNPRAADPFAAAGRKPRITLANQHGRIRVERR